MSQFNLRNIREISNDPLTKFANNIARKLSRFLTKDQVDQLADNEDIYTDGRDVETVVRLHDDLLSTNKFNFDIQYLPPFEPDNNKCQLWIRGMNMGNSMRDWSNTGRDISLEGDPLIVDGTPFDDGTKTAGVKSIALRFNRPTSSGVNTERIRVTESTNNKITGLVTGASWFIRFKLSSIAEQASISRTLFEKIDNTVLDEAIKVFVKDTGKLQVDVRQGGTDFSWRADTTTIAINTVYDVWITYTVSGDVVKVYINNVDQSLTSVTAGAWHAPTNDHDFYIMHRGGTSTGGYVEGDLYDFRHYHEKVVSATEVGYMNTNKWTIVNIPFGQVLVADYWATYESLSALSYTSASYTSASYTV